MLLGRHIYSFSSSSDVERIFFCRTGGGEARVPGCFAFGLPSFLSLSSPAHLAVDGPVGDADDAGAYGGEEEGAHDGAEGAHGDGMRCAEGIMNLPKEYIRSREEFICIVRWKGEIRSYVELFRRPMAAA